MATSVYTYVNAACGPLTPGPAPGFFGAYLE